VTISILPSPGLQITTHAPSPLLKERVEYYWSLRITQPPQTVHLVPDALVDVVFDVNARAAFVSAPVDAPAKYTHTEQVDFLGVSLRPGAAHPLLSVDAAALTGWQPLRDVIGEVADGLQALVFDAQDRFALLDAFFLARLVAAGSEPRIEKAIDEIVQSDGAADIAALGKDAGASPRNLGRLFDAWVGLSPKRFARVVRLQRALRCIEADPKLPLAEVALHCGYADQAHMTREMQALAGLSPKEAARALSDSFKT
jgi:AraC-like DNA-binding protein